MKKMIDPHSATDNNTIPVQVSEWLAPALLNGNGELSLQRFYLALSKSDLKWIFKAEEVEEFVSRVWEDSRIFVLHVQDIYSNDISIVCVPWEMRHNYPPVKTCCDIAHEAVHVWQRWCKIVGETNPGAEQEACTVAWILWQLLDEYVRRGLG